MIPLSQVIFDPNVYPRKKHDPALVQRYAECLEVIEARGNFICVAKDFRLMDGRHRMLAYQTRYLNQPHREIPVLVYPVDGDDAIFNLAAEINSEGRWQLVESDKRSAAIAMYQQESRPSQGEIAQRLRVRKEKVSDWLKGVLEEEEKQRKETIWELYLSCHTQEVIAEVVGLEQNTVSDFLREISEKFRGNDTDIFRDFKPQVYKLWNFAKATNEVKHFGNIPPEILDNLLYYYTQPLDVVFDPFAGGGMTIDVCTARARRYYVSDLTPIPARAEAIREWDLTQGLPLDLPVPDFVFLDPPYWKQAEQRYSQKPTDLANMDLAGFLKSIGEIAKAVKRKWNSSRPNGRLALIIGEWKEEGRFVDLAFQSYTAITKYLSCYNRIQVPYSTEVHGGAYVKQAQENKETLYLCRDLMIFGP
ncbi:MAG: ParB domain protein nuclease [Candidatus Gottesmanbacteria bacterium GW2011_GWB1_49_7]|uniref:ParB domain protein nuclease n=1 Tax=Candidatus Gottesmanbacteria bacterium GW2011_GWB1_49_7 TaxID=1618448 RepID=A0A0G1Z3F6_9BACT|nr:MAG: ParB domain protein nuclease [Candidatus Gottesmanbacteria bacterium GW2011_GWB1_49_7]